MLGAIFFALLLLSEHSEAAELIQDVNVLPTLDDIQLSLQKNWLQISSTGILFNDFAVRSLSCVTVPPLPSASAPEPVTPQTSDTDSGKISLTDQIAAAHADTVVAQANCRYEYAAVKRKSRKRAYEIQLRKFSHRELQWIPADRWITDERTLLYVYDGHCRYMGRTPRPGECNHWIIKLPWAPKPVTADPK
jgi:hypothetical protein